MLRVAPVNSWNPPNHPTKGKNDSPVGTGCWRWTEQQRGGCRIQQADSYQLSAAHSALHTRVGVQLPPRQLLPPHLILTPIHGTRTDIHIYNMHITFLTCLGHSQPTFQKLKKSTWGDLQDDRGV